MFVWYSQLVRNAIKSKFTYSDWRIAFDGEGSWSCGNHVARNLVIIGVDDNSSSSHTDNRKNYLLVLGEGPTQGINDSTGATEKKKY